VENQLLGKTLSGSSAVLVLEQVDGYAVLTQRGGDVGGFGVRIGRERRRTASVP
jgi:hypothetical protein